MIINKISRIFFAGLALSFVLFSCDDSPDYEDPNIQLQKDITAIENHLAGSFPPYVRDPQGVFMVITKPGTGLPAQYTSTVDVDYTGRLFPNGSVFDDGNIDASMSDPNLISGWKLALTTLPEGSEATIYIPSYYGYRTEGNGAIPPNAILEFDITVNEVIVTTAQQQKLASDTVAIDKYLEGKGINAIKDTTGLRYVITEEGTGPKPSWYSRLKLKYTFKLLTDDTKALVTVENEPSESFYSRVVDYIPHGMKIGLQKLPEGSKAVFYMPSGLAFGPQGASDQNTGTTIPANSNLIVEIELIDVQ